MCCVCRLLCVDVYGCVVCAGVWCAPPRHAAGGSMRCLTRGEACPSAQGGRGVDALPRREGRAAHRAKKDCGGALRVRAKTNKKAPPPPKRGEAKLAVPPLFCTGIPLMQISLRLNAARRLRLVSAHRTGAWRTAQGPGAPHRGAWRTAQGAWRTAQGGLAHRTGGSGAPHRGAWRTAQGAGRTAQGGLAHRTGGSGAPHRGAWRTAQGAGRTAQGGLARGAGSAERLGRELRRAAAQGVLSAGDTRSLVHSRRDYFLRHGLWAIFAKESKSYRCILTALHRNVKRELLRIVRAGLCVL